MNAPSNVAGRLARVLRAISSCEPSGATTSAIARQTGLARPTAHRLLSSLLAEGFVDRDQGGSWVLGPEVYLLGTAAASRYDVTALAQPVIRKLALSTGESAFLSARRGNETVCLIREDGSFPIRSHVLYEGIRFPLGVASAGLAILSYLTDVEVNDHLAHSDLATQYGDAHTPQPVWDRVQFTREQGYALNPGLIVQGSWGIGAAIFDRNDQPSWALSLTGIEQRFGTTRRSELGTTLLRAAHHLTLRLRDRS